MLSLAWPWLSLRTKFQSFVLFLALRVKSLVLCLALRLEPLVLHGLGLEGAVLAKDYIKDQCQRQHH